MKGKKVLIFDGISGAPLAREVRDEFVGLEADVVYLDNKKLVRKKFYKVRSSLSKILNKRKKKDSFYHLPKTSTEKFRKILERERPEIVLVVGFIYKFICPQGLLELKKEFNFSLFLYDTDSCNLYPKRREFVFFLENELPVYDTIFSFSQVTTRFFKEAFKLNSSYLPFGAKEIPSSVVKNKNTDVLFVGSADLRRVFLLEHIRNKNLGIYGSRWERNFPLMSNELKAKISPDPLWGESLHEHLHSSKIVLNITRSDFYGAETGVNLRIFEALAAGAFLLTDYCVELEGLFELGVEIETYSSSEEFVQKVNYYLEHDQEREAIARRGHERYLKEYTWKHCVERMVAGMLK
ncbi:MAG: glycosyltransferase [Lentisphaeraceae bacterium]|nr:glycosyltransferase [Lentisphaeraceae bacterium]